MRPAWIGLPYELLSVRSFVSAWFGKARGLQRDVTDDEAATLRATSTKPIHCPNTFSTRGGRFAPMPSRSGATTCGREP